ncbi:MAG TPA: VWA domain-containing protein, partial [Candidatus Sulfotelmatobacter sp.]|nr:VWA domain-containing protein [Candidatus Sulfotelmatobacter sp.]
VPRQRLRFSWLLLLQLLAATLLVMGLVRPAVMAQAQLAGHTIVIIDTSASMQATDVPPNRFDAARQQVRDLIDEVGPSNRVTLISMGEEPRVVTSTTGDRDVLRAALNSVSPTAGGADLRGALTLAQAAGGAARDTKLVLLSDGRADPLGDPYKLPFPVEYRVVGKDAENLTITAVTLGSSQGRKSASVHAANLGHARHHTTVELRADGRLIDARPLDIEPGSGADADFQVPSGTDHVTATLTPHDALALDDSATAVARAPRTYIIQLVTRQNLFLERALALRPDVRVTTTTPEKFSPSATVDAYVFDGFVPATLPSQPYWIVGPPATPSIGAGGAVSPGRPRPASAGDPLLADVDLSDVHIARTHDLRASNFGRPLVESAAGPLIVVRDETPRAILVGFDVHESDLPLRAAFPVLVNNLSSFVLPPLESSRSHEPSEPVEIPVDRGTRSIRVIKPDGSGSVMTVTPGGTAVDRDTAQLGLYRVSENGAKEVTYEFAVNLSDPARSTISPIRDLQLTGTAAVSGHLTGGAGSSEVWPWLATAALAMLAIEWWRFHRAR